MADRDAAIKQALEQLRNKNKGGTMAEDNTSIKRAIVTIKVFGVGGGGNSVLERIAESDFPDIDLVAVNTDTNALKFSNIGAIKTIQIGETLTKGRGTGGNVMVGELAAKNDADRLKSMMLGADMIFRRHGDGRGSDRREDRQGSGHAHRRRRDDPFYLRGRAQTAHCQSGHHQNAIVYGRAHHRQER